MLRVLDDHTVAYLDLVGSGAETIAHLRENGRIVVMLCAFDGPPRILRLHGRGEFVTADDPRFEELMERCDFEQPAVSESRRAVVLVHVTRVADSCGYGVPLMSYEGRRPHMDAWATKRVRTGGTDAMRDYQREKNVKSLDGLPAVELELTAQLSKPSPRRSSSRSHSPRRPCRRSAAASRLRVSSITPQRSGSGGNGSGFVLHVAQPRRLGAAAGQQVERHARAEAAGADAEPGVPGGIGDAAAVRGAEERGEAAARVDRPAPAVREAHALELREGGEEVLREPRERGVALSQVRPDAVAEVVDRVVAAPQDAVVARSGGSSGTGSRSRRCPGGASTRRRAAARR